MNRLQRSYPSSSQAYPHGSGMEPGPSEPISEYGEILRQLEIDPAWRIFRRRIMGSNLASAAQWVATYQLFRRFRSSPLVQPDRIIIRPQMISDIITDAQTGTQNMLWDFNTLSVITGMSAQVFGDGSNMGQFRLSVRAGSDGGYVIGTDRVRTSLAALANLPDIDSGVPRAFQPTQASVNNPWTGVLQGIGVGENTDVHVTFYGVSLWTPEGQIQ